MGKLVIVVDGVSHQYFVVSRVWVCAVCSQWMPAPMCACTLNQFTLYSSLYYYYCYSCVILFEVHICSKQINERKSTRCRKKSIRCTISENLARQHLDLIACKRKKKAMQKTIVAQWLDASCTWTDSCERWAMSDDKRIDNWIIIVPVRCLFSPFSCDANRTMEQENGTLRSPLSPGSQLQCHFLPSDLYPAI